MKIACDFGHDITGGDIGASGYFVETNINRQYGPLVIAGLEKLGHTVYNVTPTQTNLTLDQSLAFRVNKANSLNVDLFVSCHVNAFEKDKAEGCEVEYISSKAKVYADNVCTQMASLGFTHRGSVSRPNLYVLKYTNATAILIEPFFCDTKTDCDKYNAVKLSNAIVKGITGKDIPVPVVVATPIMAPKPAKYRVIAGSYVNEVDADKQIVSLKAKGFESFKIMI